MCKNKIKTYQPSIPDTLLKICSKHKCTAEVQFERQDNWVHGVGNVLSLTWVGPLHWNVWQKWAAKFMTIALQQPNPFFRLYT